MKLESLRFLAAGLCVGLMAHLFVRTKAFMRRYGGKMYYLNETDLVEVFLKTFVGLACMGLAVFVVALSVTVIIDVGYVALANMTLTSLMGALVVGAIACVFIACLGDSAVALAVTLTAMVIGAALGAVAGADPDVTAKSVLLAAVIATTASAAVCHGVMAWIERNGRNIRGTRRTGVAVRVAVTEAVAPLSKQLGAVMTALKIAEIRQTTASTERRDLIMKHAALVRERLDELESSGADTDAERYRLVHELAGLDPSVSIEDIETMLTPRPTAKA